MQRHRDRERAQEALVLAAVQVLDEIREAARELVDKAAYHRAAADELRDVARKLVGEDDDGE